MSDQDPQTAIELAAAKRVVTDGPRTLEAKWLDPKCWDGCQSLVFKAQVESLQAELAAFHAAMQRERKPDWEQSLNHLANELDSASEYPASAPKRISEYLRRAARQLRYMATSFTHKANFVPTDLEIKALKEKVQLLEKQNQAMWNALKLVSEEIGDMALLLMESEEQENSTIGQAWRALIKTVVLPALSHTAGHHYKSPEEVAAIVAWVNETCEFIRITPVNPLNDWLRERNELLRKAKDII